MRALALALTVLLVLAAVPAQGQEDVEAIGKVNRILSVPPGGTPVIEPGGRGVMVLNLTNPYASAMRNITLRLEIYAFAVLQDYRLLDDGTWPTETPYIEESGRRVYEPVVDDLAAGASILVRYTVVTSEEMPHGDAFNAAAFFVRTWLEFDFDATTCQRCTMASRGFFTNEEWAEATAYNETTPCPDGECLGGVNLVYLGGLVGLPRLNGILPDTGFAVRDPIPQWPLYLLVGLTAFFLLLAFLFYAQENPKEFPRVERSWARVRGRLKAMVRRPRPPKTGG
jgi:hypothetical protein